MAYATSPQALSYCGRLAKTTTANSFPSTLDLATFLTDRSNIIDATLKGRGLTVPVTGPAAVGRGTSPSTTSVIVDTGSPRTS